MAHSPLVKSTALVVFTFIAVYSTHLAAATPGVPVLPKVMPAPQLAKPSVWEPDYQELDRQATDREKVSQLFLQNAREFLSHSGMDPHTVELELMPFAEATPTSAGWRALAKVSVDEEDDGQLLRRLLFNPDYWLNPAQTNRFTHHRWAKLMWHEMHHLNYFPINLRRAADLMTEFPPRQSEDLPQWRWKWVALMEPIEEVEAERECLERYRTAFGDVPDELMRDSRSDMLKHATRYQTLLKGVLAAVRDPEAVLSQFPPELPVDKDGNILPNKTT